MMNHKGYLGVATIDDEAKVLRGEVVNIADTVTFQGRTYDELAEAFVDSVEDYLEFCASLGRPPDKPFSGKITLRIKPDVHQALSVVAKAKGKSLNTLTSQVLGGYAKKHVAEVTRHATSGNIRGVKAEREGVPTEVKRAKKERTKAVR